MLWSTADSSSVPASYASLNDDRSGDVAAVPVIASGVDVADPTFVVNEAGYKQELMANGFSQLMNFSFCFTAVAVTASISVLFNYGLGTGGPAVMIWSARRNSAGLLARSPCAQGRAGTNTEADV